VRHQRTRIVQADSGSDPESESWRQSAGRSRQSESDSLPEWFPHSCSDYRSRTKSDCTIRVPSECKPGQASATIVGPREFLPPATTLCSHVLNLTSSLFTVHRVKPVLKWLEDMKMRRNHYVIIWDHWEAMTNTKCDVFTFGHEGPVVCELESSTAHIWTVGRTVLY
jgi:hypothetical protein